MITGIVLLALLVLSSAFPIPVASNQASFTIQAVYAGTLMLDLSGPLYVSWFLGDLSAYCDGEVDSVSLSVRYDLNITFELVPGEGITSILGVNLLVESLQVTPECVREKVNSAFSGFTVSENNDIPLQPELWNSTLTLKAPRKTGVIVGVVRLDVDLIHVSNLTTEEGISTSEYTRYDLYYEPLTGLPVHYVVTRVKSSINGRIIYVSYTLLDSDLEVFRSIRRKVFEIAVSSPNGNSTVTLILLYLPEDHGGQADLDPYIVSENNTIKVSFATPQLCFMQLGVLLEEVSANVPLQAYTIPGGVIYYTPKTLKCSSIQVFIPVKHVAGLKEQVDFPEKGLPPQMPLEAPSDLLVSVPIVALILVAVYQLSVRISDRLVKGEE
ncbi:MAG: hypothetical protein QXH02_00525 [Desulfurococcaceae archaeon]